MKVPGNFDNINSTYGKYSITECPRIRCIGVTMLVSNTKRNVFNDNWYHVRVKRLKGPEEGVWHSLNPDGLREAKVYKVYYADKA